MKRIVVLAAGLSAALLTSSAQAGFVASAGPATKAPCTQSAMNKLVGPKSQTSLTARWWACRYGFAVAAGNSDVVGFGVAVAQSVDGRWVIRRGLDDGACDFASPGTDCLGYPAPPLHLAHRRLMRLIYAAGLTVIGDETITLPAPRHHKTYFAEGHDSRYPVRRPSGMRISGDSTAYLRHATWSRWGRNSAQGHGRLALNDCSPDCARGHFHSYPVRVSLAYPTGCSNIWLFDWITIRYRKAVPPNGHRVETDAPFVLGCQ